MTDCIINYSTKVTKYYTRHYIANKGDSFRYVPNIDYCCDEMNNFLNKHDTISIDLGSNVAVEMRFVSYLGYYGENDYSSVIIRFCPFCGSKILLNKVKEKKT